MKKRKLKSAAPWTPMRIVCTAGIVIFLAAIGIAVYMMANNMGPVLCLGLSHVPAVGVSGPKNEIKIL